MRSVFFNVFQSLIVVLYVLDNETNTVVRISVIIGLAIEVWKIFKVIDVKVRPTESTFVLCVQEIGQSCSYTVYLQYMSSLWVYITKTLVG